MGVYDSQIALALRMIKAKGRAITLVKVTVEGDYDLVTDLPNDVSETRITAYALVLPPSTMTEQSYASQFASGDLIRSNTRNVTIAAKDLGFYPVEGDQAEFDDAVWTFIGVKPLAPNGEVIILEGVVKR